MNEVKFRVWDRQYRIMYKVQKLFWNLGGRISFIKPFDDEPLKCIHPEDGDLMQYSGKKDATEWEDLTEEERTKWTQDGNMPSAWNGKEVYAGDIVSYPKYPDHTAITGSRQLPGLVVFEDGEFRVKSKNPRMSSRSLHYWTKENNGLGVVSVIGNICEGPETKEDFHC